MGEAYRYLLEQRLDDGPLGDEEATRRLQAWWAERGVQRDGLARRLRATPSDQVTARRCWAVVVAGVARSPPPAYLAEFDTCGRLSPAHQGVSTATVKLGEEPFLWSPPSAVLHRMVVRKLCTPVAVSRCASERLPQYRVMNNLQSTCPPSYSPATSGSWATMARALRRGLVAGRRPGCCAGFTFLPKCGTPRMTTPAISCASRRRAHPKVLVPWCRIFRRPGFGVFRSSVGGRSDVHLMALAGEPGRSKNGIRWHHEVLREGDVVEIDGMLVTSRLAYHGRPGPHDALCIGRGEPRRRALPEVHVGNGVPDSRYLEGGAESMPFGGLARVRGCRPAKLRPTSRTAPRARRVNRSAVRNIFLSGMPGAAVAGRLCAARRRR